MNILRITVTIFLCVSILFLPWYVQAILLCVAIIYFREYYESFFVLTCMIAITGHIFVPLILLGLVFVGIEYTKTRLILR